ncbi:dihydrolipoyl dehydrogenase [Anaeromicrobium sediminis]|uniref:Dihydrolipoyl dehydrogenase n=1 Tax=Anaeromicrobium sediminis TaxID=1478221 RepID=A0A267MMC6_9FIRM|nr:dihydrolipoyl dehydrogenase [Anaeromicrobium sediminis]PAB60562.1 dihydrolipoyl dehydrogenase [Anaeromicrobium sediminis]
MNTFDFDVIVIGSGSGGTACALRCADNGKKVLLVDKRGKDGPGGTCVNRGCIPTKALLRSVRALEDIKKAKKFGIEVKDFDVNFKRVMASKNKIVQQLNFGLKQFVIGGRDNIELRVGTKAEILDGHRVKLTGKDGVQEVTAKDGIVISTGSEPSMIPAFNIDRKNVFTSDEALTLKEVPKDMVVIGAGAIGIEMSTIYNAMGCKVTIIEAAKDVSPLLQDASMSKLVAEHLEKEGITVLTDVKIEKVEIVEDKKVKSYLNNGEILETENVLVGIGRTSNIYDLGLENVAEVKIERGKIVINEHMQTGVKSIYAVGDIVAGPQLSHKAQNEGVIAAENICGNKVTLDYSVLPWIIFGVPEIAKVGLSEDEARERGIHVLTGYIQMSANEKAATMQETVGAMKMTIDKDSRKIIGAILYCTEASSLIGELAMCIKKGTTVEEMATTIHAHPTLTEAVMECAKKALGTAFHK